jgi:hypothetical protein
VGYGKADGRAREDVQCPHESFRFEVPDFYVTVLTTSEDCAVPRDETENASVAATESISKEQARFGALPDLVEIVQCKMTRNSRLGY